MRQWILDSSWPFKYHFKLKNQRNWLKLVWMLKVWSVINCIFVHWTKKLTFKCINHGLNHLLFFSPLKLIKFMYSEKATKFCKTFTFLLSYLVPVKSKVKVSQNFVACSEYMNFTLPHTLNCICVSLFKYHIWISKQF